MGVLNDIEPAPNYMNLTSYITNMVDNDTFKVSLTRNMDVEDGTQPAEYKNLHINFIDDTAPKQHHTTQPLKITHTMTTKCQIMIQTDSGANCSVTNDRTLLIRYKNIHKFPLGGIQDGQPAIYCTGKGYIPWVSEEQHILLIPCYYSSQAAETIISPTDIVQQNIKDYHGWGQQVNVDTGKGKITLYHRDGITHANFNLQMKQGLWYYTLDCSATDACPLQAPTIHRLTRQAEHELWHQRLGHPGTHITSIIHQHVDNLPHLHSHPFYKCATCALQKITRRPTTVSIHSTTADAATATAPTPRQETVTTESSASPAAIDDEPPRLHLPGEAFSMDYGFMRGSDFQTTTSSGKTLTSIDGYNSYLIIEDRATRYTWVYLTNTKTPPIDIVRTFLKQQGNNTSQLKTIRTDEGGELWNSSQFKRMVYEEGFILEPTAPGAPFQNGMVERQNQTLAQITRCLLHSSGLGSQYWSFALMQAVYIKNRLPHSSTNMTPLLAYTGKRPDANDF